MEVFIPILALPVCGIALSYIYVAIKLPKIWLLGFFISMPFFFTMSGEGISAFEVILGGFNFLSIISWIIWYMAKGNRLIKSWGDYLIILFVLLTLTNSVIAYLNHVRLLDWASEYSLFLLILYYFPIREIFGKDDKSFRQLLIIFSCLIPLFFALSAYDYFMRLSGGKVYAYQLQASRSVLLGPVFAIFLVYSIPVFFYIKGFWKRFGLALVVFISSIGLLQTFTRSLWVTAFVSIIIAMCFLNYKMNFVIVTAFVVTLLTLYTSALVYNPRLTNIAVKLIANRFVESTQFKGGDRSMDYRFVEAEGAYRNMHGNYLGGNGLRSKYSNWDMIGQFHVRHSFIHIGIVSQVYKLGIPITILLCAIFINAFYKSIATLVRRKFFGEKHMYHALAVGSFAITPIVLSMLFMTGVLETRYGNAMFGIMFAIVTVLYNKSNDLISESHRYEDSDL